MLVQGRFDIKHWMVGISFDRYNLMISVGPLNVLFFNESRYNKDEKRAMEEYLLAQQQLRGED